MDDLVTWLRAQLDEDEQDIRESRALVPGELHWSMPAWLDRNYLLREVEAKRRILDEVIPEMDGMTDQIHSEWGVGPIDPTTYESLALLRLLALPYADRGGYREEWRP